jgi:hypothetical protein
MGMTKLQFIPNSTKKIYLLHGCYGNKLETCDTEYIDGEYY